MANDTGKTTEKYPTHRCVECSLVRCDSPGLTCDECRAHLAAPKQAEPAPRTCLKPADHPNGCGCTAVGYPWLAGMFP